MATLEQYLQELKNSIPAQLIRGSVAGTAGFVPDALNTLRTPYPMEVTGEVDYSKQVDVPYGSDYWLKKLPLSPDNKIGEVAGLIGSFAPINPVPIAKGAVKAGRGAVGLLGKEIDAAMMGESGGLLGAAVAPSKPAFVVPQKTGSPHKLDPEKLVRQASGETAPQAEALRIAQRNAALPVSEGGLGLPAGNTAMDRAKAMGFDTPVYHATDASEDFTVFKPSREGKFGSGIYTSFEPSYAEKYAGGENVRTLPLLSKGQMASDDTRVDVLDSLRQQMALKDPNFSVLEWKQRANKMLSDKGYSGVDVDKERLILNPSHLRSRFAAFDPMRSSEADILAGMIPFSMLADESQKKQKKSLLE
jgi:hypothetical protein